MNFVPPPQVPPLRESRVHASLRLHEEEPDEADINILADLSAEDYSQILTAAQPRRYAIGDSVFQQGEEHEGIFILTAGEIRSYYIGPSGREITLAYWAPGNFVGGPELFGRGRHMWSGQATKPTEVLQIRGPALRTLMLAIPRLAVAMVEALAHKGKCYSALLQMLGTRSAAERLAQLLLLLGTLDGQRTERGLRIKRSLTQEDLAKMVGSTRQWVTSSLDRLRTEGLIEGASHHITILDEARLRLFAGHPAEA